MHDSLYFSDHHLQVREMVRDFARNVVKPTARQYDLDKIGRASCRERV